MVTITGKKYSEKDSELEANALENIKCREGVCLSTDAKPTNPPIDTSLTIAGAAADSKAAGDKLSELKEGFNSILSRLNALGV